MTDKEKLIEILSNWNGGLKEDIADEILKSFVSKSVEKKPDKKLISDLLAELVFWSSYKHEGEHEYIDKVDEGCHLCQKAEKERYLRTILIIDEANNILRGMRNDRQRENIQDIIRNPAI